MMDVESLEDVRRVRTALRDEMLNASLAASRARTAGRAAYHPRPESAPTVPYTDPRLRPAKKRNHLRLVPPPEEA